MLKKIFEVLEKTQSTKISSTQKSNLLQLGKVSANTLGRACRELFEGHIKQYRAVWPGLINYQI